MTLEEVAEYLRLGVHTVYKMAQKGKIPALKRLVSSGDLRKRMLTIGLQAVNLSKGQNMEEKVGSVDLGLYSRPYLSIEVK